MARVDKESDAERFVMGIDHEELRFLITSAVLQVADEFGEHAQAYPQPEIALEYALLRKAASVCDIQADNLGFPDTEEVDEYLQRNLSK